MNETEDIVFVVEHVKYDFETITVCVTSNLDKMIEKCSSIQGDYNIQVWKNGKFEDLFMDIEDIT